MSRFIRTVAVTVLLVAPASLTAKPPPNPSDQILLDGLHAMRDILTGSSEQGSPTAQQVAPQAQPTGDHDQGDEHASDVALLKVCNHDNPSAERAAICPKPNSPP